VSRNPLASGGSTPRSLLLGFTPNIRNGTTAARLGGWMFAPFHLLQADPEVNCHCLRIPEKEEERTGKAKQRRSNLRRKLNYTNDTLPSSRHTVKEQTKCPNAFTISGKRTDNPMQMIHRPKLLYPPRSPSVTGLNISIPIPAPTCSGPL